MNKKKILCLAISFLFSAQTFFYIKEFYFAYIFSKIFIPALGIISLAYFFITPQNNFNLKNFRYGPALFGAFFLMLGCVSSSFFYGQNFIDTISSQAKVLPFFNYYFIILILLMLKPSIDEIYYCFVFLGVFLCITYNLAAIFVDVPSLWTKESSIFVNDAKGFRIRFPSAAIVFAYFLFLNSYMETKSKLFLAVYLFLLYFFVFNFKQRVELVAIIFATIFVILKIKNRFMFFLSPAIFSLMVIFIYDGLSSNSVFDEIGDDTSWLARQRQLDYVYEVFDKYFLSYIFGVGKISEVGSMTYEDLLGFKFTTADLGWIGVLHEYGFLGIVAVFLFVYFIFNDLRFNLSKINKKYKLIIISIDSYMCVALILSILAPRYLYLSGAFVTFWAISVYVRNLSFENP